MNIASFAPLAVVLPILGAALTFLLIRHSRAQRAVSIGLLVHADTEAMALVQRCEQRGLCELGRLEPVHVAAYVEHLGQTHAAPSVKQHLAAIRKTLEASLAFWVLYLAITIALLWLVARVWDRVALLREHGIVIHLLRCTDPGLVGAILSVGKGSVLTPRGHVSLRLVTRTRAPPPAQRAPALPLPPAASPSTRSCGGAMLPAVPA